MKSKLIAISTVLTCVVAFTGKMSAQIPAVQDLSEGIPGSTPQTPDSKDSYSMQPLVEIAGIGCPNQVALIETVPVTSVAVNPTLQLDQFTQANYQQMAATLDGSSFVPDDRNTYYSAYVNTNTETIHGWAANVENVEPNCNGALVTITVVPMMSSSNAGAGRHRRRGQLPRAVPDLPMARLPTSEHSTRMERPERRSR